MTSVPRFGYRFGNCELSVINRKLFVDGQPVDLQPRAYELLLYLTEHAGRLVTKDELLDNVWGQRFVTESVVARMVMKVRKAIGDDASDPRFILTQYGVGYRFVGEVERIAEPRPDGRVDVEPQADAPQAKATEEVSVVEPTDTASAEQLRPWRRFALPIAATLAFIALFVIVALRPIQSAGLPRVAVLPVHDGTGDTALAWTELGLMSAIGDAVQARVAVDLISEAEVLTVLTAVPGDALTTQRLEAVRARLNADALVIGRLHRSGQVFGLETELFGQHGRSSLGVVSDKEPAAMVEPVGSLVVQALEPALGRRSATADHAFACSMASPPEK